MVACQNTYILTTGATSETEDFTFKADMMPKVEIIINAGTIIIKKRLRLECAI